MKVTIRSNTSFCGVIEKKLNSPVVPVQFKGQTYDVSRKAERFAKKAGEILIPFGTAIGILNTAIRAFAETAVPAAAGATSIGAKLMPLVYMVQDFAFPVGIGVATWGLVEVIIGNVGSGKQKIKYSIIGYVGIFVLPFVFESIKAAFRGV